MGGEFLEGEFFRGPLLLEKQSQKIRPKNSGSKFVSQNSGLNSGSGGAKSPVQTFVPDDSCNLGGWKTYCSAPSKTSFGGLRKWDSSGLCLFPSRKMIWREPRGRKHIIGGGGGGGGPKAFLGRGFMVCFPLP